MSKARVLTTETSPLVNVTNATLLTIPNTAFKRGKYTITGPRVREDVK